MGILSLLHDYASVMHDYGMEASSEAKSVLYPTRRWP